MDKNEIASELIQELIQDAYSKRTQTLIEYGKAISEINAILLFIKPVGKDDKTGLLLVDRLNSVIQKRDYHIQTIDTIIRKLQDMAFDARKKELL